MPCARQCLTESCPRLCPCYVGIIRHRMNLPDDSASTYKSVSSLILWYYWQRRGAPGSWLHRIKSHLSAWRLLLLGTPHHIRAAKAGCSSIIETPNPSHPIKMSLKLLRRPDDT
jgi:hypothetical protein